MNDTQGPEGECNAGERERPAGCLRRWDSVREGPRAPGFPKRTQGTGVDAGTRVSAEDAPCPWSQPRPRMEVLREKARFSTAPSPAQRPEKGPRGGSASPRPAPLRPTHGVPSPPRPSSCGKSGPGLCCSAWGGRTRCERSRSGPRCWCWGRWRASASEVSEAPGGGNAAPRWSASGILPQPRWQRWSGETRPARLLTERAGPGWGRRSLEPPGGPSRPRSVRVTGYAGDGPPGRRRLWPGEAPALGGLAVRAALSPAFSRGCALRR